MAGGKPNLQKASEILLTDFRAGSLGAITLETPEQLQLWLDAAQKQDALRAEQKRARDSARKGGPRVQAAD